MQGPPERRRHAIDAWCGGGDGSHAYEARLDLLVECNVGRVGAREHGQRRWRGPRILGDGARDAAWRNGAADGGGATEEVRQHVLEHHERLIEPLDQPDDGKLVLHVGHRRTDGALRKSCNGAVLTVRSWASAGAVAVAAATLA